MGKRDRRHSLKMRQRTAQAKKKDRIKRRRAVAAQQRAGGKSGKGDAG